jgi:hypothetical protein
MIFILDYFPKRAQNKNTIKGVFRKATGLRRSEFSAENYATAFMVFLFLRATTSS